MEPITYEDVAMHVYMSSYHFHRTFSLVTGITANEYIRNRRLSMAGQALSVSDAKVIDIALKYGYVMDYCIGETWGKIFSEFLPSSDYNMIDDTDFELYSEESKADCC